jgi:cell division protein ZipA
MDLRWILLFISVILIAMIAWHGSKLSLLSGLKARFTRKKREEYFQDYSEEIQDDLFPEDDLFHEEGLFPEEDPLDELPSPPRRENKIFCLHIKAAEGRYFGGEQLVVHLNRAGLRFGEFDIFHYQNIFSLASAFEPGTFDLDRLDTLRTSGLSLFMESARLDDLRDGFETMLNTAQHLAEQLRATLCDDKWQPLTEQSLSRYLDQIDAVTPAQ